MVALIDIRRMRPEDIAAADALREQANWNQTIDDWQRVLAWQPEGCLVAEHEGRIVGTVTTTIFSSELAWVGMMLVDQASRSQGIGRRLLLHALDWLESCQVGCVGLDATPQGKLLYDTVGFVDAYTLSRRHGIAPRVAAPSGVVAVQQPDLLRLAQLDRCALGVDRGRLLRDLHAAHPRGCFMLARDGGLAGYAFSRPGARRWYVGPVVARDGDTADAVLRATLAPLSEQPVVIDTPDNNAAATQLAESFGFTPARPFIRMWRGRPLPASEASMCFAICGPEIG